MNIHQEKTLKKVKDSELAKKLLKYALPYWKSTLLSIILAATLVVAALAQPYIIKVAIDDRMNGIYQPMASWTMDTDVNEIETVLNEQGLKPHTLAEWDEAGFYRVRVNDVDQELPASFTKKQIIQLDNQYYMLDQWISANALVKMVSSDDANTIVTVGEASLSAQPLSKADIQLFRHEDYLGFIFLGVLFLCAVLLVAILNFFQTNILQYTGQSVIIDIRNDMFRKLSLLHNGFFDKNPVGRIVTRVSQDVEALNQLYSQVIVNLVKEICMLIGILFVMLQLSVELTLVSFIAIPILVIITFYYRNIIREAQRYARAMLSKLNSFLAENLSGMRIIQMFTREDRQMVKFNEMNDEYYRAGMRATILNSIFNPTVGFVGNLALALIIWYGGRSVIAGGITFGIVYAFTLYIRQFYQPLLGLADRYNQIQMAMASAERIFELLEEEPEISNADQTQSLPVATLGHIVFDHVWFAYNNEDFVLKDVSFEIKPGETVAFVGATGAGKTSVISLINRFYDVQKGSIRLDGLDLRDVRVEDLRRRIGVIQQEPFVFSGNTDFNIRLHHENVSREDVIKAANSLKLAEFIEKLPKGYDTLLGEQGMTLSAGQKQLLSFLRAAVYDPAVLILDEATANIDTETEQVVQKALNQISKERTTIIIAHRLSTVRDVDKIIVMHKGKVQEIGNHEQLLSEKGFYYRLIEAQNHSRTQVINETKNETVAIAAD